MKLTEKAFYDYLHCPLYFYCKYALKVPLSRQRPLADCIQNTIKYFYLGLLEGQVKTYKQIQNKWDTLAKEAHLTEKELIAGWGKVVRIVEWSKTQKIIVGDLNCSYHFTNAHHILEGQIDYILIYPNHEIELLYFELSDKKLTELEVHKKLKYAFDYFGFEKIYNQKPHRIKIYQPRYDEELVIPLLESDKKRAASVLYNVGESITQKLYVPREGYLCHQCQAENYCRFYSNETKRI